MSCTCGKTTASVGGSEVHCPLKQGAIWVHVMDDDATDLGAIPVAVDGDPRPTTRGTGLAVFDPLPFAHWRRRNHRAQGPENQSGEQGLEAGVLSAPYVSGPPSGVFAVTGFATSALPFSPGLRGRCSRSRPNA